VIYFIWDSGSGNVKVGYSSEPVARLRDLQCANSYPLFLLGLTEGDPTEERMLHIHLEQFRMSGEWFRGCPDLFAEIRSLLNGKEVRVLPSPKPKRESIRESVGAVASVWLTHRFRERREWPSDELLRIAKRDGLSRNALWSEETLSLPIVKKPRTSADGSKRWFWVARPGWPDAFEITP
jgi:hypothetical protein